MKSQAFSNIIYKKDKIKYLPCKPGKEETADYRLHKPFVHWTEAGGTNTTSYTDVIIHVVTSGEYTRVLQHRHNLIYSRGHSYLQ
jgi:hypothetical protein